MMKRKTTLIKAAGALSPVGEAKVLLTEVRELILSARQSVAQTVNSALTVLYWEIGRRIREDLLKSKRAGYVENSVAALRRQLGWTHIKAIIALDESLKRDFYTEMCRLEQWSTRTLNQKIQLMLFERTALSKKPDKLIAAELQQLTAAPLRTIENHE